MQSVGAAEFMEYFDKGLQLNFPFLHKMKVAAAEFDKEERPSPMQGEKRENAEGRGHKWREIIDKGYLLYF